MDALSAIADVTIIMSAAINTTSRLFIVLTFFLNNCDS
jgi:hypothetical protein